MIFELKIALRFMKSGKSQTMFIVVGIALGVTVVIFLGLLINSLQDSLVDQTIGNSEQNDENASILRGNYSPFQKNLSNWSLIIDEIKGDERVTAISPVLQGTALTRNAGKDKSVQIKGIELEAADPIYEISPRLVEGNPLVEGNSSNISLRLPNGEVVQLLVAGIFDLQNESVNGSLIFMDLKRAQKLFDSGSAISSIEIQIEDPFKAGVVAEEWRAQLEGG